MKKTQSVVFASEAHRQLLKGAEVLYSAVKSTMGPSGHSVIIDNDESAPLVTKDGVTVAKAINLRDRVPSIGAELIKEVASKTNEAAGDGTSTSVVLAYGLLQQGVKMIATGRSSIGLKRGMDLASAVVIEALKRNTVAVGSSDDIINVGTISANGDRQVGELLNAAISRVGADGIITVEPAKSVNTSLEVVEGMQFDGGYVSPYFVTNQEKLTCELHEPYVLITSKKLTTLKELLPVLELVANTNKPLLVIGDEVDGEVLHTLLVNKMKGVLFSCAVKAPSYGENRANVLSDIALVTRGTVFDASSGTALQNLELKDLGTCSKVIVSRGNTTIVGHGGKEDVQEQISERVNSLRKLLNTETLDDLQRNNVRKRLAKLAGGIAVVKVGGSTEVEIFEKKDRVEDALNATVAAVQEGVLPGGGAALYYASRDAEKLINWLALSDDENAGANMVLTVCKLPLRVIVENTGKSADVVLERLERHTATKTFGYNAHTHAYEDMLETGVLDPLKVERFALEHATSVVGLMLTANAVVVNDEEGTKQ